MILLKGGKLVTAAGLVEASVLVEGGKISKIGRALSSSGAQVIDATGQLVLPGAIDSHVHFRDPENTAKEDFSTGSASALAGGVTTVMDMPNYRNPPTTTKAAYQEKQKIVAKHSRCDYLLRFGASENNQSEAAASGAFSLKIFMTDTNSELCCSKQATIAHLAAFPKHHPVCVHAEDGEMISERAGKFQAQHEIQSAQVSHSGCKFALEAASKSKRRIHLCHLTTAAEVDMVRQHKNATFEITPNHLFLSQKELHSLKELGRINPPLRTEGERVALWRKLGADAIIASDHAPHLIEHKLAGAPGFAGVGTMLPLMLQAVHERKLPIELLAQMLSFNPASAFGLKGKGELKVGNDADIVLVDMHKSWRITADNRLSKCGWTPFEGKEVRGKIESVYLRGKLAYDGENIVSKPGQGKEATFLK